MPLPQVQIETTSTSLLPRLVGATNLLCFLPRETLEDVEGVTHLREVMLKETTMKRTIVVLTRRNAYLSPAAQMLLGILKVEGAQLFNGRQVV
ncbi:DNA-binding transcriptional regulator CynR [compost metagenome]